MADYIIRDARPDDAPFLAKCIMAGMHFYDFETDIPDESDIYERLIECERREDLLYSYRYTRVAEMDGTLVGSLLSYPGEIYRVMRHRTFSEIWPDLAQMDAESEMETGPGEYYLDTLAVVPSCRHRGIGKALLVDGIQKGESLGYDRIALVADSDMPHLVRLYESIGFVPADHRHAFGVDFQRMIYEVKSAAGSVRRI
ncbi:MAG: GNAT family N-acetyltransferase [Candidatus Methanomethylophilaceae archaeon]|nr:GNAT family N-acetyltransferase [Candidatus Methanomethylophilaceae archaeon]